MFQITNNTRSTRSVYDRRNRLTTVDPGKTVSIDISSDVARAMKRRGWAVEGDFAPEEIRGSTPGSEFFDRKDGASEEGGDTIVEEGDSASKILEDNDAGTIDFFKMVARAKKVLGDDWPRGSPNKKQVIALLTRRAKNEEQ